THHSHSLSLHDALPILNNDKEANIDIDEVTGSFRRNSELPEREERPFDESDEQEETWRKDKVGDDLDVPGAELDDDLEDIGEERSEEHTSELQSRENLV